MEAKLLNGQNANAKPASEDKLYNLSMVESVSGGNTDFIKKMILLFIDAVPKDVVMMRSACAAKNWAQVSKTAHKLKSTIDSMAIKTIQQDIRTIESNAKQLVELDLIPALVEKVENTINTCLVQLSTEIA
ncbi:MAG TPA: Hpt domain-containing protein [Puia sp.]|nr:Hpt domain-containing protein [Puia sp.]